jgi:type I restriction enzyme, S subunit
MPERKSVVWAYRTLGEIVELFDHQRIPLNSRERQARRGPFPYYGAQGIIDHIDGYIFDGRYILVAEDGENLKSKKLPLALFATGKFWVNNHAHVLRGQRGLVDDTYLLACLNNADIRPYVTGAAQPKLSQANLRQIAVPLPSLPVQQRVARVLSAYDGLIENCQRRIRILERMARALYKEWFVDFRYRGHRAIRHVDSVIGSIPKGWEVTKLGEELAELESGKRPKGGIRNVVDGVPSIGAENIEGIGSHDFTSEKFVPREFFEEMNKGVVHDRDVAIYKDGAYIGKSSYFRDGFPHAGCCVNEHVFLLRAKGDRLTQNALYLWLQQPDTVHAIRATNANAAQPGINQQSVGGLELIVPGPKIASEFDQLVEPMLAALINHAKRIQNLRRTRDLLLPRLLSGNCSLNV